MNPTPKIIRANTTVNLFRDVHTIWRHRELLYLFAWRDYKLKFRQTLIGISWAILQPLLAMIAFVLIFGRFKDITDTGLPYALFVYSGLILWQFFSGSVYESSVSLVLVKEMIHKVHFPRILVPLSKIGAQMIDLGFSLIVLFGLIVYFRIFPSWQIIYVVPVFILLFFATASLGIFFSALNVKYRDVQYALPYFIQLGFFFSPVIYASGHFGSYRNLLALNPMTGIIETWRSALFAQPFPLLSFLIGTMVTIIFLLVGLYYFSKTEGEFSDII
jgi:lipopolysaccharide transport system permease protein